MKLIFTITVISKVTNFTSYQQYAIRPEDKPATTIQEAAALEQKWLDEGVTDPYDLLGINNVTIKVVGVE